MLNNFFKNFANYKYRPLREIEINDDVIIISLIHHFVNRKLISI